MVIQTLSVRVLKTIAGIQVQIVFRGLHPELFINYKKLVVVLFVFIFSLLCMAYIIEIIRNH